MTEKVIGATRGHMVAIVKALPDVAMKHRFISAVTLFGIWYVFENVLHFTVAAKGVEIAIFPYADALLKELGGLVE